VLGKSFSAVQWVLFFECSDCVQMMHGTVSTLMQFTVIYICFNYEEEKAHFIFPTTKGSMNACMELVGLNTSTRVKNRCNKSLCSTCGYQYKTNIRFGLF